MARENQEKLFIHAFREVRAYILKNKLGEGDILPSEAQLCQEIGVSRNVLREAIKSMELMGLVKACPGRGTEVRSFNLDFIFQHVLFFNMAEDASHVRQLFEIRKTLELGNMRMAFDRITPEQVKHLRKLVEKMKISWAEKGYFTEEDQEFHQTLFSSVDNPILNSLLDAVWTIDNNFQLEEKMPHLATSVTKHDEIVRGLEIYDYMTFARAMDRHYSCGKYSRSEQGYEEY